MYIYIDPLSHKPFSLTWFEDDVEPGCGGDAMSLDVLGPAVVEALVAQLRILDLDPAGRVKRDAWVLAQRNRISVFEPTDEEEEDEEEEEEEGEEEEEEVEDEEVEEEAEEEKEKKGVIVWPNVWDGETSVRPHSFSGHLRLRHALY